MVDEKKSSAVHNPPDFDDTFKASLHDLFAWRRDVRRFLVDPIKPAAIDKLIATASLAPSVGNSQPWRFVSVDAPERRAAMRANFEAANADALSDYSGEQAKETVGKMASSDLTLTLNSQHRMDDMMSELEQTNEKITEELQHMSGISEDISNDVELATQSMQFEDMTNQLLEHLYKRVDTLRGFSTASSHLRHDICDVQNKNKSVRLEEHIEYLQHAMSTAHALSEKTIMNPVHQASMNAGEIELF